MRRRAAAVACLATLALSGCSALSSTGAGPTAGTRTGTPTAPASPSVAPTTSAPPACTPATLKTKKPHTLTVGTGTPAYGPWFSGNTPGNGKGFESAVAYAVAKQLGYVPTQVRWVRAPFDAAIKATAKNYDFDIDQVSITAARTKVVDFSPGYYDVAQAIVALKSNRFATAAGVDALHGAKLGAHAGTTSVDAIKNQIRPAAAAHVYPTKDAAIQALKAGQIDGLVIDLPGALHLTSAELSGATIVGQLPVVGAPEKFGLVLTKKSPLTTCVSAAVIALENDGTLGTLQTQWLTTYAGAPVLH